MTAQARAAEKILRRLEALGIPADAACSRCGFDPESIEGPENRMPFRQLCELYEIAAEISGDPAFGLHLACVTELKQFDVVGYAASASRDVGEALARIARYYRIWCDAGEIRVIRHADSLEIVYHLLLDGPPFRQDAEFSIAMIVNSIGALTGSPLRPLVVRFRHRAPECTAEHQRMFPCALEFEAARDSVVCAPGIAAVPVLSADPHLIRMVERHAEDLLRALPEPGDIRTQVRTAILRALPGGDPRLEAVARNMGLSARTLQRRLEAAGASFEAMLEGERRELALSYLRQPRLSLGEVAYLLGFSEPSAFHRAFRRWMGVTPTEFRHRPVSSGPQVIAGSPGRPRPSD